MKASAADVLKVIGETSYAFEINGKTLVIIPFLDEEEAKAELDKVGAAYESVFTDAYEIIAYEDVVADKL